MSTNEDGKATTLLDDLRDRRTKLVDKWDEYIQARENERAAFETRTDVTDADVDAFRAADDAFRAESDRRKAEILELDERIDVQENIAKRRVKGAELAKEQDIRVVSEPLTYMRENSQGTSYYRDLAIVSNSQAAAGCQLSSLPQAQARLFRHAAEMDVEMPKRAKERADRAQRQVEAAEKEFRKSFVPAMQVRRDLADFNPFERRVNPTRIDGQGGYFVPPLWLDEYIAGLRPGRVAADRCRHMDLPAGTDSINVPKLQTLTITGIQGADNAPVPSQDFTDTAVTANVKTITGQEDIAIQLLDQSPYYLDQVLTTDLLADYDKQLDLQVIAGNGTTTGQQGQPPGGSIQGLYSSAGASPWSGYNGVTYTNGAPAPWHMFAVLGAMASKVAKTRFTLSSLAYVLHPSRALWFASGSDSNNRPLIESRNFGPFNVEAIEADAVPAEGMIMQLPWGPTVYHDANVPTSDTAGGGTGQDIAIGAVFDDAWLFEGEMRTRVLPEVLSGTLQVRIQIYNYLAFLVRYGQSIAIGSGSGFAAPTAATSAGTATTF